MAVSVTFNKRVPPSAASRGTLAELMAKQKMAMDAASSATQMETPTIMQGLGKLGMIGANVFKEKRAEKAGAAGRADLAKMISGFNPDDPNVQQTIGNMSVIDPAAAQFYQEAILERQQQAAKDAADAAPEAWKPSDIGSLRDDYTKAASVYDNAAPSWESMQRAANTALSLPQTDKPGRGAADYNLIVGFAKLLDPNSVVREGEVQSASMTGGMLDQLQGWLNTVTGDGMLSDDVRRAIMTEAGSRMRGYYDQARTKREWISGIATRHGVNPDDVLPPMPGAFTDWAAPDAGPVPPTPPETPPETPAPEVDTGPAFVPKPEGYVGHWPETEEQWLRMSPEQRQALINAGADPRNRTPPRVVGP